MVKRSNYRLAEAYYKMALSMKPDIKEAWSKKYAEEDLITSEFNLLELAYALVRDYEVNRALEILRIVRASVDMVTSTNKDYVEAAALCIKLRKEKRNLSIIDALGYALARKHGALFLTGDREFKDLEGVEYVK